MNYESFLQKLVENSNNIFILTAENRAAIRNLPHIIGNRFLDVGIAEQTMIGIAAGLALRGNIPIVHALASFLTMRAFEFIRTDIGVPNLPVKIVGSFSGFLSEANGPTHQAIEDISLMRTIPNINIFCPADEEDMLIGLPKIINSHLPFYIRYNNQKPIIKHEQNFSIGSAEIINDGRDITILTYGLLLSEAYKASIILRERGFSTKLVNLRTLKPIDSEVIIKSLKHSKFIVTVEDHFLIGGLYSIVAELALKHQINSKVIPFALDSRWFQPSLLKNIIEHENFTGEKIAYRIMENINNKHSGF